MVNLIANISETIEVLNLSRYLSIPNEAVAVAVVVVVVVAVAVAVVAAVQEQQY